jgi:transcriptional regulator of acetoin/glycerol metabolism
MSSYRKKSAHCPWEAKIMIAPVKEARKFLEAQWPPRPTIRMSKEEYRAMLSKARIDQGEKKAKIACEMGISRETLYQYLRQALP